MLLLWHPLLTFAGGRQELLMESSKLGSAVEQVLL